MRSNKRKKRGKKLIGTLAFLLTVAAVATVISLAMFFNIEAVHVTGLTSYTQEEVIGVSGIVQGQNIFSVDSGEVRRRIYESFPYVNSVKVVRLLPTTVVLEVTETTAVSAIINGPKSYTLIGANGRILRHVQDVSTEGIPIVIGANLSQLPEGALVTQQELADRTRLVAEKSRLAEDKVITEEEYKAEQDYLALLHTAVGKLDTARHLLEAAEKAGLEKISYYDVGDDLAVSLLYDHRVVLELGTELELPYKMKFATEVIGELADNFCGTVNLTTAGNNSRVYAREQDIVPLMNKIYHDDYY